jgi:hypothetical protein
MNKTKNKNEASAPADKSARFYECGICGCLHPWKWDSDCRDDLNRLSWDQIPADAVVLSMDERVQADSIE